MGSAHTLSTAQVRERVPPAPLTFNVPLCHSRPRGPLLHPRVSHCAVLSCAGRRGGSPSAPRTRRAPPAAAPPPRPPAPSLPCWGRLLGGRLRTPAGACALLLARGRPGPRPRLPRRPRGRPRRLLIGGLGPGLAVDQSWRESGRGAEWRRLRTRAAARGPCGCRRRRRSRCWRSSCGATRRAGPAPGGCPGRRAAGRWSWRPCGCRAPWWRRAATGRGCGTRAGPSRCAAWSGCRADGPASSQVTRRPRPALSLWSPVFPSRPQSRLPRAFPFSLKWGLAVLSRLASNSGAPASLRPQPPRSGAGSGARSFTCWASALPLSCPAALLLGSLGKDPWLLYLSPAASSPVTSLLPHQALGDAVLGNACLLPRCWCSDLSWHQTHRTLGHLKAQGAVPAPGCQEVQEGLECAFLTSSQEVPCHWLGRSLR